ncbi:MAG: carbamoyltransferase [Rhodobacteraceae bacterium]|nr:carbamoyltransferase [Paracoccaceae bacterium]
MSVILGLNAHHPDAAACLLIDGQLVGAVAEERLGPRIKHSDAFPEHAILWLLSENGLRLRDVGHVAVARDPWANAAAKLRHGLRHPSAAWRFLGRQRAGRVGLGGLARMCGEDPARVTFRIHRVEHHLAHIASAYFASDFDAVTAGVSYDGSGDFASAMVARCEGNRIEVCQRAMLPHSLGHFYTALSQFIGFDRFGEEYKVMGLAPYGEDRFAREIEQILPCGGRELVQVAEGALKPAANLNASLYFTRISDLFGPPRHRNDPITQREKDIARSVQLRFEAAALHLFGRAHDLIPTARLALAGGCGLNGVMNARIPRDTEFTAVFHQPASADDGTALGAALHCWHVGLGRTERFRMQHAFWGPEYSDAEIRAAIDQAGLRAEQMPSPAAAAERAADLIADGAVIGWYQGRSEWGPRALGNRSILANPAAADMKATINARIKRRESFRPFAPSVLAEDAAEYFEQPTTSPFMMHVVRFRRKWRDRFPAVTHVDGTGRLHTVDATTNPLFHHLIRAVKSRTGHGMVLNTSFNENEPIVDRPEQAIACYLRTDLDALVLGRHVLVKRAAP